MNSAPTLGGVVMQELGLGEGPAVEAGDSLEVAYTGWLLQNHALGQVGSTSTSTQNHALGRVGSH